MRSKQQKAKGQRSSVSAEVYGIFNKKEDFKPKVIPKSNEQRQTIINKVTQSFLFNSLEDKELNTVIDAMEEKKYKAGENVITQGESGDVLYLVEQGNLDCCKVFVSISAYFRHREQLKPTLRHITLEKPSENWPCYTTPRGQRL